MHHRPFRKMGVAFTIVGVMAVVGAVMPHSSAAQSARTKGATVVIKPGVDLPSSRVKRLKNERSRFSALALDPADYSTSHISVSGVNSVRAAAEVARRVCNEKAKPGRSCEVVALKFPSSKGHSFASAMKVSGVSAECAYMLSVMGRPRSRPLAMVEPECSLAFLSGGSKLTSQPGHTMYFARNDLWSGAIVYGPDPAKVKAGALKLCRHLHKEAMASFANPQRGRTEYQVDSPRDNDIVAESKAIYALAKAQPQLGKCRVVMEERLP